MSRLLQVIHRFAVAFAIHQPALEVVGEHGLQAQDRHDPITALVQVLDTALLAIDQDDGIANQQAVLLERPAVRRMLLPPVIRSSMIRTVCPGMTRPSISCFSPSGRT